LEVFPHDLLPPEHIQPLTATATASSPQGRDHEDTGWGEKKSENLLIIILISHILSHIAGTNF
jgi:hypothetical protein